LTILSYRKATT